MYSDAYISVVLLNIVRILCGLIILSAVLFSKPIRENKKAFAFFGVLGMALLVLMVVLSHRDGRIIAYDADVIDEMADGDIDSLDDIILPYEDQELAGDTELSEGYYDEETGEYIENLLGEFDPDSEDIQDELEGFDAYADYAKNYEYHEYEEDASNEDTEDSDYDDDSDYNGRNSSARTDYEFPLMNGEAYRSNVLGICYVIGNRWKYADEAKLAAHDGVSANNFQSKLASDIMSGNGYRSEMFAESSDGYKTVGVTVVYSGATNSGQVRAELEEMVGTSGFYNESAVAKQYGASSADVSIEDTTFCGKQAKKVHLVANYSSGAVLYSDVIIFANNGFIGIVTANSVNEEDPELLDSFFTL